MKKLLTALLIIIIIVAAGAVVYFNYGLGWLKDICPHIEGATVRVKDPTCTEEGLDEISCRICGATVRQVAVKVRDHEDTDLNCACDDCGAINHAPGQWQTTVTATCLENGEKTLFCDTCGEILDQMTTQKGDCVDKNGDCQCDVCYEISHTEGEWQVLKKATCKEVGLKKLACTSCGKVLYEEDIPLVDHVFVGGHCDYCGCENPFDDVTLGLYNSTYGYDYLGTMADGDKLQAVYKRMDEKVRAFHESTTLSPDNCEVSTVNYAELGVTTDQAIAVWKTYRDDNPLYFWLSYEIKYTSTYFIILSYEEYKSAPVRQAAITSLTNTVSSMFVAAGSDLSDYEYALSFHDQIVEMTDYAYDENGKPSMDPLAHSCMGVFTGTGAVCEGYAHAYQLLLNAAGIDNVFVTGYSASQDHAWNAVELDGKWFWCDVTWDDTPEIGWGISHNYFMVNSTQPVDWRDGGWVSAGKSFSKTHACNLPSGKGISFLYGLPSISTDVWGGAGALRSTFTVDGLTYGVVGFRRVQLINADLSGDLVIPDTVEWGGQRYRVSSVGCFDENGVIKSGSVITGAPTTVTIGKNLEYVWDGALSSPYTVGFFVDDDNTALCDYSGALFTKGLYTLIAYPAARANEGFSVPDGTHDVAYLAFEGCENLKTLHLGAGVKYVGTLNWGYGYPVAYDANRQNSVSQGALARIYYQMGGSKEITVSKDNLNFVLEGGAIYSADKTVFYTLSGYVSQISLPKELKTLDLINGEINGLMLGDWLKSISVDGENPYYSSEDGLLYNKDKTLLVTAPPALSGTVTLAGSLEEIGVYALGYCQKITAVVLPASLRTIGKNAFVYAFKLDYLFYSGNATDFEAVKIASGNDGLSVYLYSPDRPDTSGRYWRYVLGVPTPWTL